MPSVAAIVVTYNRKELLATCLQHLRAQEIEAPGWALDVLVVDNASTDGTREMLADDIDAGRVRYVNAGQNLGGAGGFSFGMREAMRLGFDYLWVMDDDCLPDPGALQAFIEVAEREQAQGRTWGFLSSVVRWTDGSICQMNVQRHPLFSNIEDFSPAQQPASLASFVSLFVPAARVREVGLPIAEFFVWTDDWEFTRRLSRRYPCYVVGGSTVVHASATNSPGNIYTDSADRLDRYELIYRNDVVLYRKEGLKGKAFLATRATYHMARVIAAPVDQKRRRLGIIARSNLAGLRFHPQIHYASIGDADGRDGALAAAPAAAPGPCTAGASTPADATTSSSETKGD